MFFLRLLRPPRSTRPYPLVPYTTRFRSDDRGDPGAARARRGGDGGVPPPLPSREPDHPVPAGGAPPGPARRRAGPGGRRTGVRRVGQGQLTRVSPASRSEEHTSELQSLMRISYAVFCLKKKKKQTT